jgi:hypothetical protein
MSGSAAISGTLLSSAYAATLLQRDEASQRRGAERDLVRWWRIVHVRCGPASSIRALADLAAAPLAALLGFTLHQPEPLTDTTWIAVLEGDGGGVPLVLTGWGASLDGAWRTSVRHSLSRHARWCVLFNGTHLRVLDAGRTFARRYIEFDLEATADDASTARLVVLLASATSLGNASDDSLAPLATAVAASDAHGQRVCSSLRGGVHRAIEHLLAGLMVARRGRRAPPLEALYEQALTAVYRILFLCFAEARGLVPTWHPVYRDAYTMESLRTIAEGAHRPDGLWESFQAISRLAHQGCEAGDLRVTAFNGRLFAPARAPLLDGAVLPDGQMRDVVLALSTTISRGRTRERVSYRDLGVEELGAVYEGLIDYEPALERSAAQSAAVGSSPAIVLARSSVSRRKATGSFYTPRPITRFLVRQALEPFVKDATAARVLGLRVLDPAMGSGAFLVAACRFLARAYETALVRDGECHEGDIGPADRAGFRRLIAQRCLFGVDLNPMAVHLARLSLWLTTLAADKPLTFLDHHLLAGDSLVGASPSDVARQPPGRKRGRRSDERQLPLFDPSTLGEAAAGVRATRREIEQTLDDTAAIVRRKEQTLAALAANGALRSWKTIADLWCAAWFKGTATPVNVFHALVDHVLTEHCPLPPAMATRLLAEAHGIAASRRFFHWQLEFPEVFFGPDGREHPDGGFDAIIGNPPWEMLRADAGASAAGEKAERSSVLRFTRDSGVYHAQSQGHANQYHLFVERALHLARPDGRVALVVPSGIAHDHGSAALRHLLLRQSRVESIIGFDNRTGVFPIHRSVRFVLLTATRGGDTATVRCRFGLEDPAALDALGEGASDPEAPHWFSLTPGLLEQLSGPGLAIPDLRSPLDLAILQKAVREHPPLASADGWHVRFGRELNASDDREHFTTGRRGLPVIEGKHLTPFAVDRKAVTLRIGAGVAARLLHSRTTFARPRLAFRDVASATNRTTLIAAIVPGGCVTTHTLFCLRSPLDMNAQLVLCALFNSYAANFLVRLRVSTHVSLAVMDALPVPRIVAGSALEQELLQCARTLTADPAHRGAAANMHAAAACAYGLTREEFAHVLDSFPLVPRDERQAALDSGIWSRQIEHGSPVRLQQASDPRNPRQ